METICEKLRKLIPLSGVTDQWGTDLDKVVMTLVLNDGKEQTRVRLDHFREKAQDAIPRMTFCLMLDPMGFIILIALWHVFLVILWLPRL